MEIVAIICFGIVFGCWFVEYEQGRERQQQIQSQERSSRKAAEARARYEATPAGIEAATRRQLNRLERRRPKFYMTPDGLTQFGGDK
jgi:hypothetical protein